MKDCGKRSVWHRRPRAIRGLRFALHAVPTLPAAACEAATGAFRRRALPKIRKRQQPPSNEALRSGILASLVTVFPAGCRLAFVRAVGNERAFLATLAPAEERPASQLTNEAAADSTGRGSELRPAHDGVGAGARPELT